MTEVYLTDWDYSVAAEDISATYGTDPIATDGTQYSFVAANQNFVQDAITSLDGRDVTGAGEEGGPPIIKALQRDFPLVIPRATPADLAWLAAFAMSGNTDEATPKATLGQIDLTVSGTDPTAGSLVGYAMYPSEVPGEIKRTTLEATQGAQGGRYLDCFVNSLQLRMDTGAQARSLAVNAGLILPGAELAQVGTPQVIPSGGASADLDGGSLAMRISKNDNRLDADWRMTANRDNQLSLSDSILNGTTNTDLFDVSSNMDYWQWGYNNNVDIDALFRFNTGLRMGQPRRGQRGQTLEIGVPRGLMGTDWPGDAEAGTVFAVELIVQGVEVVNASTTWHSGFRLIWPTCYLQSTPSYAKGPQEYQRLQFVPKELGGEPTVWMDVFFKPYTTATGKLAGVTADIDP